MSAEEVNDKFKQWNPMEIDYKNTKFNQYITGPGAELEAELQTGQKTQQSGKEKSERQPKPTLIFKNVPKDMTKNALYNICSRHGRVTDIRNSLKNSLYFMNLATVSDMEAVLRAMDNNNYGFTVFVDKNMPKQKQSTDMDKNKIDSDFTPIPSTSTTGIDYNSRSYRVSNKQHPRPKIKEESLLDSKEAVKNSDISLQLIAKDAHNLERQGLYKMPNNRKFNYRNGRSYVNMPEKTKEFIDKKHQESSGKYNESTKKYVHTSQKPLMPNNFGKCSLCFYACDTICARCSQYYCSVECQLSDWSEHRYICGKPKNLQKSPPSAKEKDIADHNSARNSKVAATTSANKQKTPALIKDKQIISSQKTENNSKKKPHSVAHARSNHVQASTSNKENSYIGQENDANKTFNVSSTSSDYNSKTPSPPKQNEKLTDQLPKHSDSAAQAQFSTEKENEIDKQNMPRSGNIVTITAISKTNVVFIRSKTYEDNLSYFRTIDSLQNIGNMLTPIKVLPKHGQMVIAKFEQQYNRALVLSVTKQEKIIVNFMDYGNLEEKTLSDLYEAPKELMNKPRHAIPVLLKDVPDLYMTEELRKFMYTYLNNINVEIRYKPEDFQKENRVYSVELIDEITQQNLNKMITKLAKPVEPQSIDDICCRGYLEQMFLPSGDNVELIVMDNSLMSSGCVSCTTKAYAIEIQNFQKELHRYAESLPKEAYTPRADELCIARYNEDGQWYRGICIETVGDGHPSIHFIDYGNITIIPIEEIRRYPRQFTYPIYTADCEIKGLPENCDDKIVAKLEQLIPNGEFIKCENVTAFEDDNFYIISLPHVIRELMACGLLKNDQRVM